MSAQGYKYVIEHMEDDDATTTSVPPWVRLEYAQMLKNAGRQSKVLFTSLSAPSAAALPAQLAQAVGDAPDVAACQATTTPILDLLATAGPDGSPVPISKVCLLDPRAPQVLSPADGAPGAFEFFLFGGILGDDPPRDRTGELRKLGFETRHLGSVQMTTDTALGVTKIIIDDKIPLDEISYVDHPTIRFNDKESVEMPFRYVKGPDGEPILPAGMRELLQQDLNKTFDEF
ncbi:hypothetical protein NliqN6_2967 [Naganishia liquefaciens]|uniref:DUF431-domain-containing protein n=1 Tax=Naganishia liquefaciens TaxID=104408 RepID=A0A8H3TTV0_9TREE|nr:hypothetical protein NliqN6_2967 [Naganishia liquefaciens]